MSDFGPTIRKKVLQLLQRWSDKDLAVLRISLYGSLALHFLPTLLFFNENYAPDVFRLPAKNMHMYKEFVQLPPLAIIASVISLIVGLSLGIAGIAARFAAGLTLLGTYVFLQGNAVNTQTLGMQAAYGILLSLLVSGSGSTSLSLAPKLGFAKAKHSYDALGRWMVVTYIMSSLFFAGWEKVFSGWVPDNTLYDYLSSPKGILLRDWAAWFPLFDQKWFGAIMGMLVVSTEILGSALVFYKPTRPWALGILALMLTGFTISLQIPLLFPAIYLPVLVVGLRLGE